ncbi:MAG: ferredoxin [Thermodesulfobacteriota bacterium]
MARFPEIDLSRCNQCLGCQELCPEVFCLCAAGYMAVAEMNKYPEERIDEAVAKCPRACLIWMETNQP